MAWTALTFGKHADKTLPQVVIADPDWFYNAIEKKFFEGNGKIFDEAKEVCHKSKRIRIPQNGGRKLYADYIIYKNVLHALEIEDSDRPMDTGILRKEHIDLSTAREFKKYDKLGCKILIADFKEIIFGSKSYKMTKKICEEFFENDDNFDL
jgi:hypothetical protein